MYVCITGNYIDLSGEGYIFLGPCLRHLKGPPIVIGWPTKKHKVVYVLVIWLHQSHWVNPHSHCVARLSHWAAHHSYWETGPSHWVAHHVHGVAPLSLATVSYSGNSGCYISGEWQFGMLHSG